MSAVNSRGNLTQDNLKLTNLTNKNLFDSAKQVIPGGVNSPVRSFSAVSGVPFFTKKAVGAVLTDIENKQYIDYICSWGANIVGHANPYVVEAVRSALENGFSYGTPTELEVSLAAKIISLMPSIEKLRLVSSGTEAVMSAIRLARGYTGKKYIVKFNGCYHGHSDSLLVAAGSGLATHGHPNSDGVTEESVFHTLVLEYNDADGLGEVFTKYADEIAAVIVEPFAGNMNLVRPSDKFLTALRELCDQHNSVLIFDEVMTGFRVSLGGAQELLNIKPDLTILGKVIGGGMPLAAFGGKAQIMDCLSPAGAVYQAGTLSGNPIAVTCGLATLELVQQPGFYTAISQISKQLTDGLKQLADKHGMEFCVDYVGGMFGFYFNEQLPQNLAQVRQSSIDQFRTFFHLMLAGGVYFAPSMFEAGFVCSEHTPAILDCTLQVANKAFILLK